MAENTFFDNIDYEFVNESNTYMELAQKQHNYINSVFKSLTELIIFWNFTNKNRSPRIAQYLYGS